MIETRLIDVEPPGRGGARIAAHLRGHGPLCVLVHGYPLDHAMWHEVLHGDLAARRTLCAVDLRGHGASPWAGDRSHAMELLADDVAAVVRTLADGPADLVGLSMGGYALLAFAERHPELLRSLTLVDTRAGEDPPAGKQARRAAQDQVVARGRRWLSETMLEKLVAPGCDAWVRARLQTMIERQPVETVLADLQGMIDRPDRHDVLRRVQVPSLVVVGEHDAVTPPDVARAMVDALADSRLVVVAGAGHMTPMEAPAEFGRVLGEFLGS